MIVRECRKKIPTAKLTALAIRTTLDTVFVPEPHGRTQFPDPAELQGLPGPLTGSKPAE